MDATRRLGARILLVDDQLDQLEMYHFALERAGFVVDEADDGASALAHIRASPPDLVVLDIRLPDMTGWDVCRVLRSEPKTSRLPIIILTAAVSPTLAEDAASWGCAAHLLKPCLPEDLMKIVRTILAAA